MTRRRVGALVLVMTTAMLVPVGPVGATTTVSVDGNVVTLHVPIDVAGAKGKTVDVSDGRGGTTTMSLVDYWKSVAEEQWNDAFSRLSYRSCFIFKLDLELRARPAGFKGAKGHDLVQVSAPTNGRFTGVGWEGTAERNPDATSNDGTRSFDDDRDGIFPEDAPPTVIVHEIGHLLGLGDDRTKGGTAALPGRAGTLMVGGVPGVDPNKPLAIDQDLVDRIGKELQKATNDLPKCEIWSGTFRMTSTGKNCTSSYKGPMKVGVLGKHATGTMQASGSYTCDGFTYKESGSAVVNGKVKGDVFRLGGVTNAGTQLLGLADICLAPVIHKSSDRAAAADYTITAPSGDQYHCRMSLKRD